MTDEMRPLSNKEHRLQFLEATLATYVTLDSVLQNHNLKGNLKRGIENAICITGTTIDKLMVDYPEIQKSIDTVMDALNVEFASLTTKRGGDEKGE